MFKFLEYYPVSSVTQNSSISRRTEIDQFGPVKFFRVSVRKNMIFKL